MARFDRPQVARRLIGGFALAVLLAACSGNDSRERVSLDDLIDPSTDIDLDDVGGIELGEASPPEGLRFCDAFADAPSRWLTDALVPIQLWHDSFDDVADTPPEAEADVERLVRFSDRMLDWHFGRIDRNDRPEFDAELAGHAKHLADVAVEVCPELPLLLGQNIGGLEANPWGAIIDELSAEEIELRCAENRERIETGIGLYVDRFDEQPGHVEQIEAGLYDVFWFGSDVYGIGEAKPGAIAVPLPTGPCAAY